MTPEEKQTMDAILGRINDAARELSAAHSEMSLFWDSLHGRSDGNQGNDPQ